MSHTVRTTAKTVLAVLVVFLAAAGLLLHADVPQVPSNVWVAAGDMTTVRAGASGTLLPDGLVLVAGGIDANGATASVERFSPDGAHFLEGQPMQSARANHTATLLADGRVLVAGGAGASGAADATAEIYDPVANAWIPAGSLNVARRGHTATRLADGKVLIAGGDNNGAAIDSLEVFDPATALFTIVDGASSGARTLHAAAALLDGRVLIAGGFDGTNPLASTSIYDPETNTVLAGPDLSTPRSGLTATTLLDGRVLVAGGAGASGELASAEIFDPATNAFTATDNVLSSARQNHLALLLPHNNQVLIVGGLAGGNPVAAAEYFTPWEGTNGVFCADVICASGYQGPAAPATARAWATGSALSFPADKTIRSGPNDGLLVLAGGSGQQSSELFGFATVKTDREDYVPGTTVTITGSGWQPHESVALVLREYPLLDEHPLVDVEADEGGNIISTEFVPDEHDAGIRFFLTAYGQASQAQTTFRDNKNLVITFAGTGGGSITFSGVTPTPPTPSPNPCITSCSEGLDNNAVGTITVTANPGSVFAGWSGSFVGGGATTCSGVISPCTFSMSNAAQALTATFDAVANQTITVTTPAPPTAVYGASFNVAATASSGLAVAITTTGGCTGSGSASTTVTMTSGTVSCVVHYNQAGNGSFNAAPEVTSTTTASAKTLTASIIGNPTKPYDGNTNATLTSANFSLTGLVGTDSFTVTKTTGTYNSKDVATAATATTSLVAGDFTPVGGTLAANYSLPTTASGAGHITAKSVTASIIGDPTKPYDGNTNATLTSANFSLSGLVGAESFTVTKTTGSYNSKDVATANTITTALVTGDFSPAVGTLATNYSLPTTASGPGHISALTVTASIIGNPTKPYDGNTNATLTSANFSVSGLIGSENFTVTKTTGTYNTKDVATANLVTTSLVAGDFTPVGSALATNYTLPSSASGAGHITIATVTASIIGDPTKPYDGNTTATLTSANFSLSGLASGDSFTVTKTTGSYNTADVTTANTVTTSLAGGDFTPVGGTLASNYTLPTTASGAGHITAKSVTASIIGDPTKPYDGNTNATLTPANFSLSGLVGTESFTVTKTSGSYNTKDVATADTITSSLVTGDFSPAVGTQVTNYSLPATASGPGHISALTVTASIIGNPTKPYDGNTNATLTSANFSVSGLILGESFTVTKTAGAYNTKDVATANTVTASLVAGDFSPAAGTLATNYDLPITASGPGHITAVNVIASIIGDPTKPYDGNTNATLTSANFSVSGPVSPDGFTVTKTSGAYDSKDVAAATTVTTSLVAGDFSPAPGTVPSNYNLPTTASGPGHITAVTVTASIIGDPTKPYDGNTNAALTSANFSVSGLVGTDSFTVTKTTGAYNSKDVVAANMVTTALATADFSPAAGTLATNYNLPSTAAGPGHITAVTVTASIIGNPTKSYDGNTNATLVPGNFNLAGLASGEMFSVTKATGTYNSKDVATASSVSTSLAAGDFTPIGSALASNYVLPTNASGPGHITVATVTASIIGDPTKPYDNNTNATLTSANFSLSGLASGDGFTVTKTTGSYNSKDVATANTVTTTLVAGDLTATGGTVANNYSLPSTASGAGHITVAGVSASVVGNPTKPYDGNTNATLTPANFSLTGLIGGDMFSVTKTTGTYNSKDVSTAVTVSTLLASGDFTPIGAALASNYALPTAASGAGHITTAALTASILGDPTKPYDGNANATLTPANFVLLGAASGEGFAVTKGTGSYNSANVATASIVSTSLVAGDFTANAGTSASNYTLPTSASGPGHITKATATITVTSYHVPFDGGSHTATGAATGVLSEVLAGLNLSGTTHTAVGDYPTDPWTFTDVTGNYSNANGIVHDTIDSWTEQGYFQPVDMTTGSTIVWNTVKGGSTVPLKFKIFAGGIEKTTVTAVSGFSLVAVACLTGVDSPIDPTDLNTTGGTSLRYDGTSSQFIQNWQVPKPANQCYRAVMTAADGSQIGNAFFKTK